MREVTERTEGVEAGTAKIVGTEKKRIVRETVKLLKDQDEYEKMAKAVNPYGDGKASRRIATILKRLGKNKL
jgi:UDP-N-acetylglucosamine 2-epimerase (non-hydrolysing)